MYWFILFFVSTVCFTVANVYGLEDQLAIVILFGLNIWLCCRIENIEETISKLSEKDNEDED